MKWNKERTRLNEMKITEQHYSFDVIMFLNKVLVRGIMITYWYEANDICRCESNIIAKHLHSWCAKVSWILWRDHRNSPICRTWNFLRDHRNISICRTWYFLRDHRNSPICRTWYFLHDHRNCPTYRTWYFLSYQRATKLIFKWGGDIYCPLTRK